MTNDLYAKINEVYFKVLGHYELGVEADEIGLTIKVNGKDIAWVGVDNSGLDNDVPMIAVFSKNADDHIAWIAYEPDGVKISASVRLFRYQREFGPDGYQSLKED